MAQEGTWDYIAIPTDRGFVYAYTRTSYTIAWRLRAVQNIWNAARSDAAARQRLSATCSSWVYVYNLFYLSIWYQEEWPGHLFTKLKLVIPILIERNIARRKWICYFYLATIA